MLDELDQTHVREQDQALMPIALRAIVFVGKCRGTMLTAECFPRYFKMLSTEPCC